MAEYRVSGALESGVASALPLLDSRVAVRQAVRIEPALRDGGPVVDLDIADDDLLEVELENGFILWTTVDRLIGDAEAAGVRERGETGLPFRYPLQQRGAQRGAVSDVISSVRVLGIDVPKSAAQIAADKIEGQLAGDGKFFRIDADGNLSREDPPATDPDQPTLVLVHGTFSSTLGGYVGLFGDNGDIWKRIHDRYDGRVFGFDHRTLSASPLENALEFLDAIPRGANLHLVSHSRGGLVADLIAHGGVRGDAFAADDLKRELGRAFGKKPSLHDAQLALYEGFNRRIAAVSPRVTRYVRVGCPAAGTTLASGRLDIYLSLLINLMRQVPGVGPLLGGLGEFVAAVAKQRTKADSLPGLEAQMPKSAFIRLLNGSPHVLDTDLTVLAGDSDGFLKNLANLFYWRANDLVVDTRSMYGGAPRARRLWHLEENRHVTHMNYFSRAETARIVQRGLLRADGDTSGFNTRRPRGVVRGRVAAGRPDEHTDRTGVVLLPGIMGSNLAVVDANDRDTVWLDKFDLLRGRGRRLAMDSGHSIEPDSVLDSPYEDFRDHMVRNGLHVMPLAYDWRRSLTLAVARLDAVIRARLQASDQPLHLVAHSMGGLVASLLMAQRNETWQRLRARGGRLVQAGTPNRGSYVIPRILQGRESIVRMIAALDFDHGLETWLGWIARFPGLLELAPSFGGPDFSQVQAWRQLGAAKLPRAADLRSTEAVRQALSEQTEVLADNGVIYVAGGPEPTPVYDPVSGELRATERGDGRVTWDSGIPPGAPTWYVPVKHGSLLDARRAFDGLRELVVDGHTDQLAPDAPPASSLLRGEPLDMPMLADEALFDFLPSQEDLDAAALGMEPAYASRDVAVPPVAQCAVSIVHGDLRFCENPVMVGHYAGDQILHAEKVLDECLEGALRSRHQLDVYPGDIGTTEVVLKRDIGAQRERSPTGAIVLGLGNVGELSPGALTRAVESGLLRYAQSVRERGLNAASLKVSALLVGTGEAGVTTRQAVDAFLRAVENANDALLRVGLDDRGEAGGDESRPLVRIARLDLIELYEDVALEALHALVGMEDRPGIFVRRELQRRTGGERRPRATEAPPWWSPVQISSGKPPWLGGEDSDDSVQQLTYTAYGTRARADVAPVVVQSATVDRMVAEAIRGRAGKDGRLPKALFELLVPSEFKAASAARHRLKLLLDPGSAAYPWELLVDRKLDRDEPIGIGTTLLRQLRVEGTRKVAHTEDKRILVVGDPPSDMVPLPGAQAEAETVAELFERREGWSVIREIRSAGKPPTASSVIESLMTHDLRILHLAGHGIYDAKRPWRSGMVIGGAADSGEGYSLITAGEVGQMRLQPELVFINCCHLGRIEETEPFHKLAASLAAAFIKAGVKAVVAAGWPVEDEAAKAFCTEFYRKMIDGSDFGDAVAAARKRTYHLASNTWGAYQCYGDPGFRLLMDAGVRARALGWVYDASDILTTTELVIELDNLAQRAKVRNKPEDREVIAARRDALWTRAENHGWGEMRGVIVGFARVAGELGDFERAIELYASASKLEDGGVTLRDLEQLANLRARRGGRQQILDAIGDLEQIVATHGATAERMSLIGSAYKRLAQLGGGRQALRDAILEMTRAYVAAAELSGSEFCYPATNALLGVVLLGGPWARAPKGRTTAPVYRALEWSRRAVFDERVRDVETALRRKSFETFWDATGETDIDVVKALARDRLGDAVPEIVGRYEKALALYGSGREIDSVINQLQFAEQVTRDLGMSAPATALHALCEALE